MTPASEKRPGSHQGVPERLRSPEKLAAALGVTLPSLQSVIADPTRHYSSFPIPAGPGKQRVITPPAPWLRRIHRLLLDTVSPLFRFPVYVCGGVKRRSVSLHAERHVSKQLVMTLDVRKFYPSTRRELVLQGLLRKLPIETAEFITDLCQYEGGLPQGSPMSMFLANVAFSPADIAFRRLTRRSGLAYSRYVDDIAVSGNYDFRCLKGPFKEIIRSLRYDVADEKVLTMFRSRPQIVTGLQVNDKLRPTPAYCQEVKHTIWACLDNGPQLPADVLGITIPRLKARLTAQVGFIHHFDAELGAKLRGLLCRLWLGLAQASAVEAG